MESPNENQPLFADKILFVAFQYETPSKAPLTLYTHTYTVHRIPSY